jgi:transcriptional regulator of acetoin/glycerol metabolism
MPRVPKLGKAKGRTAAAKVRLRHLRKGRTAPAAGKATPLLLSQVLAARKPPPELTLAQVERLYIEKIVWKCRWNITHAAAVLGLNRKTLQRKLRSYWTPPG